MKIFECQHCGQLLYFENIRCESCGSALGFVSERRELSALRQDNNLWRSLAAPDRRYRYCANYNNDACNWLVDAGTGDSLCRACELNRTIPDLGSGNNLLYWQRLERAKRRMVYSLLRFDLPLASKAREPQTGLAFDFLADEPSFREDARVMTGHAHGLITINIAEADDAQRERFRTRMAEPYRTLLGHFRHEVGHYYWERLVYSDPTRLDAFRACFGNESLDYNQALQNHYNNGPPANWGQQFVSAYAASHPWEDWAETWAHYLHLVDTLETAYAFGLQLEPRTGNGRELSSHVAFDAYRQRDFDALIAAWLPLTYALNSLNRSMGHDDLYPFVLTPQIQRKMRLIHDLIYQCRRGDTDV